MGPRRIEIGKLPNLSPPHTDRTTEEKMTTMPTNAPVIIEGVPRHYDWGSRSAIPALIEMPSSGRPIAELWFGDHPSAPSPVHGAATTLGQVIAGDPEGMLGPAVVERFGNRLPFLLKILAADRALSIQVHPTLEQARVGFASEEAGGIPRDAAHRNYRDANHKPELLCALTQFDAMCGFRSRSQVLTILTELGLPELGFIRTALDDPDPLRRAFTAVLTAPESVAAVEGLTAQVARVTQGPLVSTRLVSEDCPGDVGIVLSLLLNYVRLEPGEAVYLGAGNIHAYLRGTAVEIMANSDNVLRCGLTPKHVDVPELLRIADFSELRDPRSPSEAGRFRVPVPDFALTRIELETAIAVRDPGPQLVLRTSGRALVDGVGLGPGCAVFLPAGVSATLEGHCVVYVAAVGAEDKTSSS